MAMCAERPNRKPSAYSLGSAYIPIVVVHNISVYEQPNFILIRNAKQTMEQTIHPSNTLNRTKKSLLHEYSINQTL
jgi:hypothetical protein